ncbi:MAG: hypothetical protein FJ147_04315 [Deltaproteobacteria bacterium]|nr:hypothetical protein [Deltaproteobacteria bacterium]
MNHLLSAATHFIDVYHANQRLVAQQRGWTLAIGLVAVDSGATVVVQVKDGHVIQLCEENLVADMAITAEQNTLCDILELRRSPNEPYMFGELTVRGAEADFLRLDYIATTLCPL